MFSTFEKVRTLCKNRGISLNTLEEHLGLGKNSLYSLKIKVPSADRLALIADYFGVSVDYLLGRDDKTPIEDLGKIFWRVDMSQFTEDEREEAEQELEDFYSFLRHKIQEKRKNK